MELPKLSPRKLTVPQEVLNKQKERHLKKMKENKFFNFFYIFFGEGF